MDKKDITNICKKIGAWFLAIIKDNIKYPVITLCFLFLLWVIIKTFHITQISEIGGGGFVAKFKYDDTLLNKNFANLQIRLKILEEQLEKSSKLTNQKDTVQVYKALLKAQNFDEKKTNDIKDNDIEQLLLGRVGYCLLGNFNEKEKKWDVIYLDVDSEISPQNLKQNETYSTNRNLVLNTVLPREINIKDYDIALGVIPSNSKVKLLQPPLLTAVDGINYYWIKVRYIH